MSLFCIILKVICTALAWLGLASKESGEEERDRGKEGGKKMEKGRVPFVLFPSSGTCIPS